MHIYTCPFCGPRDEREFHYAGELGKARPETTRPVTAEEWSRYLYAQRNDKGVAREVWMHIPCAELFVQERDTLTMDVLGTSSLREPS